MRRNRLIDFRLSRGPQAIGLCATDTDRLALMVNSAQQRLLYAREAGDEGWYGTWAEMAFTVTQAAPYLTCPRDVARIEKMAVCQKPVAIQNEFYEYLAFGSGPQPKICTVNNYNCGWNVMAYSRNNAITFTDLTNAPQYIRIYTADTTGADTDTIHPRRVLIQGTDANGNTIYSQDNGVQVQGIFVTIEQPFADLTQSGLPLGMNAITGIQKDVTLAPIQIYQVDPTTGDEVLLHIMEPSEQVASYRRYYLDRLPANCPCSSDGVITVTGICKLELVPVVADTDYLLIQNIEALIEECQSVRYSEADSEVGKKMAADRHGQAIRLLQGELVHYYGKEKPAMSFHPFGSVNLACKGVGQT